MVNGEWTFPHALQVLEDTEATNVNGSITLTTGVETLNLFFDTAKNVQELKFSVENVGKSGNQTFKLNRFLPSFKGKKTIV